VSASVLLDALALPQETRVDRRVAKKLLVEHGAPTTADRRQLLDGVDELLWIAALKPATVGIPAFRDDAREYLEIAVVQVSLRSGARLERVVELVHRAIPYPVVLVAVQGGGAALSLAHKRRSQAGTDAVVTETPLTTAVLDLGAPLDAAFLADLALAEQPTEHLFATYQGWLERVTALAAARVTGHYTSSASSAAAADRRAALDEHARLRREIAALRARATKEKQLARRVELNLELRRLTGRLSELTAAL
jgi:hypothetical protein